MNTDKSDTKALIESQLKQAVAAFRPPAGLKRAVREQMAAERRRQAQPPRAAVRPWLRRVAITAAAACLVVALLWLILGGGSTPSAYAELMQAIHNSQTGEWAHMVQVQGEAKLETWISFRPLRIFAKTGERATMYDPTNSRICAYDPGKRTLTIDYNPAAPYDQKVISVRKVISVPNMFEYIQLSLEMAKRDGAKVTRRDERIDGRNFTVYGMVLNAETPQQSQVRLYLDPQTNRFVKIDQLSQSGGITTTIDYPKTGPKDIYDLGVPRDAKVVDFTPSEAVNKLVATVKAQAATFPESYVAVSCRLLDSFRGPEPADRVTVTVMHVKAGRCRSDVYPVTAPWGAACPDAQTYYEEVRKTIPTDSMAALEAWAAQRKPCQVKFADADSSVLFRIGKDGKLKKETFTTPHPPGLDLWRLPIDLYRAQELKGGKGPWGPLVGLAGGPEDRRTERLFNPARDHVCEQYRRWFGQAKEPEWTAEVLEYARSSTGRWYPRKTQDLYFRQGGQEVSSAEYLSFCFVDDTRRLPDNLFDLAKIARDQLADTRTPFDREFASAIRILDARQHWPKTPEEVCKAYWNARAAKRFDEMAVLWPGSAAWNSRLKAEKPVKYVFGEARKLEGIENVVLVPYASADYCRKHGTYNLNMRLTNKRSTRGRYYITSGN